jgi:hypothetical protein
MVLDLSWTPLAVSGGAWVDGKGQAAIGSVRLAALIRITVETTVTSKRE